MTVVYLLLCIGCRTHSVLEIDHHGTTTEQILFGWWTIHIRDSEMVDCVVLLWVYQVL